MQENQPAVKVQDLFKTFKLPHEQHSGLKQVILNVFRKKDKGYVLQKVLNDISFEINKGEFFAIVGRNGSGKSTLLKLLAGIYAPDKGLVQVNGSLTPFIELGVGFNPELTGRENVYMNGALLGFDNKQMNTMYDEIVEFAELGQFMDQKLKNYSSGMQVRLAFSIAIRARSDILLLDEVLAVGDSAFQQKCLDYFNKLKEEKRTIILVTHDMGTVKRFCTRALYLKQGKVITIGDPSEVADMYLVDNMDSLRTHGKEEKEALYGLRMDVKKEDDESVEITYYYESKTDEKAYVGISILRDGVSVAEIATPQSTQLQGKGKISYTIPKSILNSGVYELTSVLCAIKGRTLLTTGANRIMFVVPGNDINRGGALKLPDNWSKPSTR